MGFEQDFAKTQPGPQRERVVYQALVNQGKPTDLWPMTVDGPNGSKITYQITRDFLKVGNQYVPMTGTTAQMIADHFHMHLPTNTIADQVWKAAKAAGSAVDVNPLSGTGYQGANGQNYSPADVVRNRISATDAAVEFSRRVNDKISQNPNAQKGLVDIGAGGKWLTVPPASGSLGLHGIRTPGGGMLQGGYGTMHPNYEDHTEYGTYVRLVDDPVTVQTTDGRKQTMTMAEFTKSPYSSALFDAHQDLRDGSLAKYDVKRDKANLASLTKDTASPATPSGAPGTLDQINKFFDEALTGMASRMSVYELLIKRAKLEEGIRIMPSIGKDPAIKDLSQNSIPGHAPAGYRPLQKGESSRQIGAAASQILNSSELGDQTPFTIGDQLYIGRTEPHYHPPPPPGADPSKYPKPWGWHKGVTVFKAQEGTKAPSGGESQEPVSGPQGRMKLLQRVQQTTPDNSLDALQKILSEIEGDI